MLRLAAALAPDLRAGDVLLLHGPLGAGKTTFARGIIHALGWPGPVRSPSFNLLQVYETDPPIAHVDLYRLESATGIGLESYLDTHLCLVEWPDRLHGMIEPAACWRVDIAFTEETARGSDCRLITMTPPSVLG